MDSKSEVRNPYHDDAKPEQRKVERVREWQHGPVPEGKSCQRKTEPIFTKPGEIPEACGITKNGYDYRGCGGDEWKSKGIVLRDGKKNVVHREPTNA
jgi:hypothetical protein